MKTTINDGNFVKPPIITLASAFIVAGFLFCAASVRAQLPPGSGCTNCPTYTWLESWSFFDPTNWLDDDGYAPISFTNLAYSYLGDGQSLVVDTNVPAWLQYNIVENDGTTNLTVDAGSVTFWFAPDWSSTNDANGGSGPQEYGRLIEVGGYTPDSSFGWWSIYVDDVGANIYFSAQTNNGSGNTYTISAPIDWTTNYWHFVALTYSSTNVSLFLDGQLATNDPGGLTLWPGANVLSNGFFVGSDSNGIYQAEGMFNNIYTYNVPLDTNTIRNAYTWNSMLYWMNPNNAKYMSRLESANSTPSSSTNYYQAITGIGNLQLIGSASYCVSSTNVWITNVVTTAAGNGAMNIMFTIEGGSNGVPYDVFANPFMAFGANGYPWTWMGQGYQCNTYLLTNLPNYTCFLILGTPKDTDGDGLTDAYELLVSKTSPTNYDSNLDGLSDSWEVLLGLNPKQNNLNNSSMRSNYSYTPADWLQGVSGVRSGAITLDPEGNVTQVSQ